MLSFSNAKINLGLNIIDKRPDGYHNIESVFYPIPWADMLEILPSEKFSFLSSGLEIAGKPDENLIVKAYELLQIENQSVKIYLHKILPMGAGLGGGSSNAAFTLKSINDVLGLGLTHATLKLHTQKLGSDCAFFLENKPLFCYKTGSEFEETSVSLKEKYLVIVNPDIHISTAEAYASIKPQQPKKPIKTIIRQPLTSWKEQLINDFEEPMMAKYPVLQEIKDYLYQKGAIYASMTGTGSTIFGIFEKEINLQSHFNKYTCWSGYLEH